MEQLGAILAIDDTKANLDILLNILSDFDVIPATNGQKAVECNYVNGECHGKYEQWYENGQKELDCNYLDGWKTGKSDSWYPNGQKI